MQFPRLRGLIDRKAKTRPLGDPMFDARPPTRATVQIVSAPTSARQGASVAIRFMIRTTDGTECGHNLFVILYDASGKRLKGKTFDGACALTSYQGTMYVTMPGSSSYKLTIRGYLSGSSNKLLGSDTHSVRLEIPPPPVSRPGPDYSTRPDLQPAQPITVTNPVPDPIPLPQPVDREPVYPDPTTAPIEPIGALPPVQEPTDFPPSISDPLSVEPGEPGISPSPDEAPSEQLWYPFKKLVNWVQNTF